MKTILLVLLTVFSMSSAHASCFGKALDAAINQYGNDPKTSSIKFGSTVNSYVVGVGKGNQEDGEHSYYVNFPNGCDQNPTIKEIVHF
jgi:hypothetical protein